MKKKPSKAGRYWCVAAGGHPCSQVYRMKGNPNEYCYEHFKKMMEDHEYA